MTGLIGKPISAGCAAFFNSAHTQLLTVTLGGTAAADAGSWDGTLRDNGDDGVPQVATGTFYSTYGPAGKMVGAFGVNKQ